MGSLSLMGEEGAHPSHWLKEPEEGAATLFTQWSPGSEMGVSSGVTEEEVLQVAAGVCPSGSQGRLGWEPQQESHPGQGGWGLTRKEAEGQARGRAWRRQRLWAALKEPGALFTLPAPLKNVFWSGPGREDMTAHPPSESQSPALLLKLGLLGGWPLCTARGRLWKRRHEAAVWRPGLTPGAPSHLLELHFLLCEGRKIPLPPGYWQGQGMRS